MAARKIQTREIAHGIGDLIAALHFEKRMTETEAKRQGYYSVNDAAKAMDLSSQTAQRRLREAVDAGVLERVTVALDVKRVGYYYRPLKMSGNSKGNLKKGK